MPHVRFTPFNARRRPILPLHQHTLFSYSIPDNLTDTVKLHRIYEKLCKNVLTNASSEVNE